MKILICCPYFAPDLTGVGKYTGEMAQALAASGFDVRVIAAPPFYPAWRRAPGYSAWDYCMESWNGVRVYRAPMWIPSKPGGLSRVVHLASFAISVLPVLLRQLGWRPQIVMVVEPTLAVVPGCIAFAWATRAKTWLHIQDFEADAVFGLGIFRNRWLQKAILGLERLLMRCFDRVSSISPKMVERAGHKGVKAERLVLFPNWVDIDYIAPLGRPSIYRSELGLDDSAIVVLYSGIMGQKQGLETLGAAARSLSAHPRIRFVFCGNGVGRAPLEAQCAGLANVIFLDLQSYEKLPELLALADIHVLPQVGQIADLVMPSKLTGMLASGKAVIAMADAQTQIGHVMQACGGLVPPGDHQMLADALVELAADDARRIQLGTLARKYAEAELAADAILDRFQQQLRGLIQARSFKG